MFSLKLYLQTKKNNKIQLQNWICDDKKEIKYRLDKILGLLYFEQVIVGTVESDTFDQVIEKVSNNPIVQGEVIKLHKFQTIPSIGLSSYISEIYSELKQYPFSDEQISKWKENPEVKKHLIEMKTWLSWNKSLHSDYSDCLIEYLIDRFKDNNLILQQIFYFKK